MLTYIITSLGIAYFMTGCASASASASQPILDPYAKSEKLRNEEKQKEEKVEQDKNK